MRTLADDLHREGGYTLPEVLVALIFLGTVVAAIIGAMGTSIIASDAHSKTVTAESVVLTYAERLQTAGYVPCQSNPVSAPAYQPGNLFSNGQYSGFAAGTGIVSVQFWNGDSPATFGPACPPTGDAGVELIRIKAVSADRRGGQTLDVIKRFAS
jgi:type II secretory pathway pseudopilin PulG